MADVVQNIFVTPPSDLYYANLCAREMVVINPGGTSSGKSYSIMQVLLTLACSQRNLEILVVGGTIPKLKEDVMRICADIILNNPNISRYVTGFNQQDRLYRFTTGSILEFKSYENSEAAKGAKPHIAYFNEATRIDYMIFWEIFIRCKIRCYLDFNPTASFWVHDKVLKEKASYPSVKVIRSWHVHNPYLSDEMHNRIESIQDKELWKVYARGLLGKLTGLVFYWSEVSEFPVEGVVEIIWGIDWGYTVDPTVVTRVAVMVDGSYVVDECCYSAGIAPSIIHHIMNESGYKDGEPVYADHDKEMIMQMRRLGVMALPAEKGGGSILNRILYCKQQIIRFTSRSVNLRIELGKYKFVEVDGNNTNKTIDSYNHAIESSTYAIFTHRNRIKK